MTSVGFDSEPLPASYTMKTFSGFMLTISMVLVLKCPAPGQEAATAPLEQRIVDPNSPDVKSSLIYDLGDRLLTVQEVTDKTLPTPPAPVTLPPAPQASALEAMKERVKQQRNRYLSFSGTVYRAANGSACSLITLYQQAGRAPLVFWSSFDWNLMTIGDFEAPDGEHYCLMLMFSTIDIAAMEARQAARGVVYKTPEIPSFTEGPASYKIVSGEATDQALADLKVLHAIYDRDKEVLLSAWKHREAVRIKAEAEKPTNPPKPEDIVLQYRMLKPEEIQSN
jgi:hypothetical protein